MLIRVPAFRSGIRSRTDGALGGEAGVNSTVNHPPSSISFPLETMLTSLTPFWKLGAAAAAGIVGIPILAVRIGTWFWSRGTARAEQSLRTAMPSNGPMIPMRGEVAWIVTEGRLTYWRGLVERRSTSFSARSKTLESFSNALGSSLKGCRVPTEHLRVLEHPSSAPMTV